MPQTCTICRHPQRADIERAVLAKEPLRHVASRHDTSTASIVRHRDKCIQDIVEEAQTAASAAVIEHARTIVEQMQELQATTMGILRDAQAVNRLGTAVMAINQARSNLELLAKLTGELDSRTQINIAIMPEWMALRSLIVDALQQHPEAMSALHVAFERAGY